MTLLRATLAGLLLAGPLPGLAVAADDADQPPPPAWTFTQEDGESMLLFGVPAEWEGSPNYIRCSDRSGRVEVEVWADHQITPNRPGGEGTTQIILRSGTIEKDFGAHAQDEEMNGGSEVTATLSADEPVLAEFARTGMIKVTAYGQASDMPAANPADAAKLVRACRKPRQAS
jgi:hypothetical protein